MNSRIPKRIIQTGKTADLCMLEKAAVANIRLLNPDFENLYFDDKAVNDFIGRKFPEYEKTFQSFRFPIQKYDFFRYLAVYHFGGFYFDLDLFLVENLSDLLKYTCVFSFERITLNRYLRRTLKIDWEIGNYAFGAAAGHPFIRKIIDNCVRAQVEPAWREMMVKSAPWLFREDAQVLCTTGPGLVSRTYSENPDSRVDVKILFPENRYDRNSWYLFGRYGVHLMESSWRRRRSRLYNFLRNYWGSRLERKYLRSR